MPNPGITTSFAAPAANACPATFAEAVTLLNALVTSSLGGTYLPHVTGSTTPAVNDQDKVWYKTDGAGRPVGIFLYYNGAWRKTYSGKPNEITIFSGNPATYFDGTGLGLTTAEWDGWAICNGNNGTVNLSDKFVIGARMDNEDVAGYDSGWQTNIGGTPEKTGGRSNYSLVNNNLPKTVIQVTGAPYDAGANHSPGKILIDDDYRQGANRTVELTRIGADPDADPPIPQVPVPTIPTFVAICYVQFVAYA